MPFTDSLADGSAAGPQALNVASLVTICELLVVVCELLIVVFRRLQPVTNSSAGRAGHFPFLERSL